MDDSGGFLEVLGARDDRVLAAPVQLDHEKRRHELPGELHLEAERPGRILRRARFIAIQIEAPIEELRASRLDGAALDERP